MILSEWLEVAAGIRDTWPHSPLPDSTLQTWGEELSDLPVEHVAAAVRALAADGREHAPHYGIIRRKVTELTLDPPDWASVLHEIGRIARKPVTIAEADDDGGLRRLRPRDEAIAQASPLVRAFIGRVGWVGIQARLDTGNDEARLRRMWEDFVERAHRDSNYAAIEAPGLRALSNGGPRKIGDVVGELEGRAVA